VGFFIFILGNNDNKDKTGKVHHDNN